MRTGQMQQVFIILAALLVIGATVYIGMKLFSGVHSAACKANDAAFMREVKSVLDANSAFGARDEARLAVPCDAVALCFVDSAVERSTFESGDPTIRAAVRGGVPTNIYLRGAKMTVPEGEYPVRLAESQDGRIAEDRDGILCINATGGKFVFRTQGYGRFITIIG